MSVNEYIDATADEVNKLTRHSYVVKSQSEFMKLLKDNITTQGMISQGNFATRLVVQDRAQSFH